MSDLQDQRDVHRTSDEVTFIRNLFMHNAKAFANYRRIVLGGFRRYGPQ
jgi:hypothetical protein